MKETSERIIVVTGGSRGIGRAICATLGAPGTTVYFNYNTDLEAAKTTAEGIQATGANAVSHSLRELAIAGAPGTHGKSQAHRGKLRRDGEAHALRSAGHDCREFFGHGFIS